MRAWITVILLFVGMFCIAGCDRNVEVNFEDETEGYEIIGKVTDALGNPIPNVAIKVYFDYQHVDDGQPPSTVYIVENRIQIIKVNVYDSEDKLVRTIYNGTHPVGPMDIEWNRTQASGAPAANGVYTVRYEIDGDVRMSYPVTIDEAVTARTDASGAYVIANKNLPVGFYPVPRYSPDEVSYYGLFRITNVVALEFITPASSHAVLVSLNNGNKSHVDIVLE